MNPLLQQALLWLVIFLSVGLTFINPESFTGPLCLLIASALFGLSLYLKEREEAEMKDIDAKINAIDQRITGLKERLDAIQLQRGLGR